MPPGFLSQPLIQRLPDLLQELRDGHLSVPRFQRAMCWPEERGRLLLQSIRDGLPIGAVLVWRTQRHLPVFEQLGPLDVPAKPDLPLRSYLIDGHQRLGVLYTALHSEMLAARNEDDNGADLWIGRAVFYDLEVQDFRIGEEHRDGHPWLPLRLLLDGRAFRSFLRGLSDETLADRAEALAQAFTTYALPVCAFATEDISVVTRTFQRINSESTKMSRAEIIHALSWTEDFDLSAALGQIRKDVPSAAWMDNDVLLNLCAIVADIDPTGEPERLGERIAREPRIVKSVTSRLNWLENALRQAGLGDLRALILEPGYDSTRSRYLQILLPLVGAVDPEKEICRPRAITALIVDFCTEPDLFEPGSTEPIRLRDLRSLSIEAVEGRWTAALKRRFMFSWTIPGLGMLDNGRAILLAMATIRNPLRIDGTEFSGIASMWQGQTLTPWYPIVSGYYSELGNVYLTKEDANKVKFTPSDIENLSERVLRSWFIEGDALKALREGDRKHFLAARQKVIVSAIEEFLNTPIGPDSSDTPLSEP